jgi:pilus assembly protein CpaF
MAGGLTLLAVDANRTIPLEDGQTLVVGRAAECGLRLDDPSVSDRHCTIACDGASVLVSDLDSANGTFVNEVRIGPQPLQLEGGDVIRVGRSQLRVEPLTSAADRQHMPTVIRRAR